jgi:predicted transcriptional regulator
VSNGNFADEEAVIEHALGLMLRDQEEAVLGIRAGLNDVAAGRIQPLKEALEDLRREFGIRIDT